MSTLASSLPLTSRSKPDAHLPFPFHAKPIPLCLEELGSQSMGLTPEVVTRRQGEYKGDLQEAGKFIATRQIFLAGFKNLMSFLLIIAAGLSFGMEQAVNGLAIIAAWLVSVGVHGLIAWKTQKTSQAQEAPSFVRCEVRRAGTTMVISAAEIVPGDILILSAGQIVHADARLLKSDTLQADESLLTGESILIAKDAQALHLPDEDPLRQSNMVFAGTRIKTGKAEALVTAIGKKTVMGKIADLAKNTSKTESSFGKELGKLGRRILLVVFVLTAAVVTLEWQRETPLNQLIQLGLILLIASLPGILPGITGLILAMGLGRLADQKIMVKNLQAVEAIGDITVLCSDKTGTLTENHLLLDKIYIPEEGALDFDPLWKNGENIRYQSLEAFLRIARLNNTTSLDGLRSQLMGDPIDVALYRCTPSEVEIGYQKRRSLPFDPAILLSSTICEGPDGQLISLIKGAPEAVLQTCKYYMRPDGEIVQTHFTNKTEFMLDNKQLAYENNLRIIGFAQKFMSSELDNPFGDAIFVGWVCLLDPPKSGVIEAIQNFRQSNVSVMMITGDQQATAEVTARELGILQADSEIWQRAQLEDCDGAIPDSVHVFARTKPEEKLYIVDALQKSGQIVAMVGDGVNDAPALQKSDVAIVMGIQGADAAKENADMLLMTDRLEGILIAMRESRIVREKITICMQYLLSCNFGLLLFITGSVIAGKGIAISLIDILWLNVVMVTLPTLMLALEPVRESVALPPPRVKRKNQSKAITPLLKPLHLFMLGYWGVTMMIAPLGVYLASMLFLKQPVVVASTMALTTMALSMTFNLFSVQFFNVSGRLERFMEAITTIPVTWVVLAAAIALQAAVIYLPIMQPIFNTVALVPFNLAICFCAALGTTLIANLLVDTSKLG